MGPTRTRRRSAVAAGLGAVALAVAGCGSTVASSAAQSGDTALAGGLGTGGDAIDSSSLGASGTSANSLGASGAATQGVNGLVEGTAGTASGAGGAGGSGSGSAASGPTSVGPAGAGGGPGGGPGGGAAKAIPMRVGFVVIKQGSANLAEVGAGTPVAFGNGQLEAGAVVADINSHGGIGGRPIQPYYAQFDASQGDTSLQADCTQLTEDDHVDVILDVINVSQDFVACAAQHHTILVNASFGAGDDADYQQYGSYFYSPSLEDLNREEHLVLDALRSTGRLGSGTKVGVAYDDSDPTNARVLDTTVAPLLRSWAVPFETYGINGLSSAQDISGAVLRFQADGVNEVVFIAPSGLIELVFMEDAEQQQYRPRYGMGDSVDTWFLGKEAPAAQVHNIFGAGTLPISNVPVAAYPTTPAEAHCLALMRAAGENDTTRHSSLTATLYCELGYELRAVAGRINGPLTASAWRAAYRAVGTSYQPVTTFAENLASGRNDNASEYRLLGWSAGCSCVAYLSALRPMPF